MSSAIRSRSLKSNTFSHIRTFRYGKRERHFQRNYTTIGNSGNRVLSALATAERAAEVEPFKTAIVLHFLRDWPFVLYAVSLLAVSLFVDRFFCRYLCPLGAALAIPARLRLFDWLRRYRECGSPCQRCGNECPVQAIHPEGHINPNECIQCLHCQMLYQHDRMCPVMIQRRLKREKYLASAPPPQPPRPAPKRPTPEPVS
jgi:NosR/NirI family transcriptional regulator, nitrous oxide reductase regulator